jgi:hypothetical protein
MSLDAMKQALEALDGLYEPGELERVNKAITALRTAIEQAEKQEPVCEVLNERGEVDYISYVPSVGTPLYTAPRKWVGLADDEIKEIIGPWGETPIKGYTRKLFDQIEAKLKEKNR